MNTMMRHLAAGFAAATLVACSEGERGVTLPQDSGPGADLGSLDGGADAQPDSGCPPSRSIAPAEVPKGYLPAKKVTLARAVDGDTAHFAFPDGGGEQICRFLYVNTEESSGAETTDFGLAAKAVVEGYLKAAKEIVIAVREDTAKPGTPDLDPYKRWLSLVFLDGALLETRLVREGWSTYYTTFGCAPEPLHSVLLHAEAEANASDRGVWTPGHPTSYAATPSAWMGKSGCRPNPFIAPYCK